MIFTDGSFTKTVSKPATAGLGFLVQPGNSEAAIHEGSGSLVTPEAISYDGLLKPTNHMAEQQAIQMSLQWCLDNPGHIHSGGRIVVCLPGQQLCHLPGELERQGQGSCHLCATPLRAAQEC